jgi:hypothetical protein
MICTKCNLDKTEDSFTWKNKAAGKRQSRCKECHNAYAKEHYSSNKEMYKSKAAKSRPALIEKGKAYVLEYLKNHPCVDCGNSDIRVLQFDHKEALMGQGRRVGSYLNSWNKLKEEIAKCDVRCANCHMIRTAEQFGWVRSLGGMADALD